MHQPVHSQQVTFTPQPPWEQLSHMYLLIIITYYLHVRYLLRIQQYPVNNTYNIREINYAGPVAFLGMAGPANPSMVLF